MVPAYSTHDDPNCSPGRYEAFFDTTTTATTIRLSYSPLPFPEPKKKIRRHRMDDAIRERVGRDWSINKRKR